MSAATTLHEFVWGDCSPVSLLGSTIDLVHMILHHYTRSALMLLAVGRTPEMELPSLRYEKYSSDTKARLSECTFLGNILGLAEDNSPLMSSYLHTDHLLPFDFATPQLSCFYV